ncbi:MAG: hypothetical protein WAO00_08410 [Chthoniobacterales bacterium]
MPWNLVEPLSAPVYPRRAFYLPLASIPPGRDTVRPVPPDVFALADDATASPDKVFNIRISPPLGGFSDEVTLPGATLSDPAYRLHAMDNGSIRFKPADGMMKDRLILSMPGFAMLSDPPWWRQWCDVDCVPTDLIYENVDRVELETRLNSLKPRESLYGLTFPPEVTNLTQRSPFITDFLAGNDKVFLNAEAGAVIGTAAVDPTNSSDRLLTLRGRYVGHSAADPQFMNPREFFYLLFGDDSSEVTSHPLLSKMDVVGKAATGMETKSIRLRPPLRTHKRVMWESDRELPIPTQIPDHSSAWKKGSSCQNRLYNTHSRQGASFQVDVYDSSPKCNLFVSDIALRSGFRVGICPVDPPNWKLGDPTYWHYAAAGRYASKANIAGNSTGLVPLNGLVESETKTWGFKIEPLLRSLDDEDFMLAYLKWAIANEGRCFILAGSRGTNVGHIMIVEKVNGPPKLVDNSKAGQGLESIAVTLREASSSSGARSGNDTCALGTGGREYFHTNFTQLHLIELHPGKDPDTDTGLRDCNVQI